MTKADIIDILRLHAKLVRDFGIRLVEETDPLEAMLILSYLTGFTSAACGMPEPECSVQAMGWHDAKRIDEQLRTAGTTH